MKTEKTSFFHTMVLDEAPHFVRKTRVRPGQHGWTSIPLSLTQPVAPWGLRLEGKGRHVVLSNSDWVIHTFGLPDTVQSSLS